MKILVCIKQVPDMESKFRIDADGIWFDQSDLAWRMNEYDEYAIEQAVQLKEQVGSAEITVLSIGPDRVKEAIKKALAMGGDRGVHVKDDASHLKTPVEIASIVYEYAKDEGFDMIFTGMQSQDRGSAQVGVLLAEMLGVPAITTIVEFSFADGTVTAKRELEGGLKAVVRASCPALVSCQLGLNKPRYPTLPNIMKAKKKPIDAREATDLLKASPLTRTEKIYYPERKGGGQVLEGDVNVQIDKLIEIMKEKTGVFK